MNVAQAARCEASCSAAYADIGADSTASAASACSARTDAPPGTHYNEGAALPRLCSLVFFDDVSIKVAAHGAMTVDFVSAATSVVEFTGTAPCSSGTATATSSSGEVTSTLTIAPVTNQSISVTINGMSGGEACPYSFTVGG